MGQVGLEALAPTNVLIRNRASGLCLTDIEVMHGTLAYPLPIALGHEGVGVVEAVGSAVTQVRPGDHMVAPAIRPFLRICMQHWDEIALRLREAPSLRMY